MRRAAGARLATALFGLAVALLCGASARAQNPAYVFASGIGGAGYDHGNAIAIDGSSNLYVTGSFKGTVDFDPGSGTANLTSTAYEGTGDIFVASYDAAGSYRWAFHVGGPPPTGMSADNLGLSIVADAGGNVVVSGLFIGTMDFDPGAGTTTLSANGRATFVAKYTPTGNHLWSFKIGTYSGWNDLAIDANGNIVVAGGFMYTVDFDPGPGTATLTSVKAKGKTQGGDQSDLFVAKYSSAGKYLWAFRLGNELAETADAVDVDGGGNIYVTGSLNTSPVDFDPGRNAATLTGAGTYLAKYTPAGAYLWAFRLGSAGFTSDRQRLDVDASGNIVLVGGFTGAVDFDPGAGTATLVGRSTTGALDLFVARYGSNGGYQWAFSPSLGSALGLTLNGNGDILVSGNFKGPNDFDPGSGVLVLDRDATYDNGGFVASYDAGGAYRWAFSIPTAATYVRGIAASSGGSIHITGTLRLAADFDPGEGVASLTPAGFSDAFIAKYNDWMMLKPAARASAVGSMVAAPNPFSDALNVQLDDATSPARIEVVDMAGRIVESVDLPDPRTKATIGERLPEGTYVVRVTQGATRRQAIVRKQR